MLKTVVKKRRREHDLTQAELAKKTGVTAAYISLIESGRRKSPSVDILKRLARSLDLSVAELLE